MLRRALAAALLTLAVPLAHAQSAWPANWTRLIVPFPPAGGTDIVTRVNAESNKVVQRQDVRDAFAQQGTDPVGGTPEAFAAQIRADIARWGKVIRDAGVKMD